MAQRAGTLLLAAGIAAASAFGALVGLFWGFGLTCDDSCSSGPLWRDDPNAWQWQAFGTVGIAGSPALLSSSPPSPCGGDGLRSPHLQPGPLSPGHSWSYLTTRDSLRMRGGAGPRLPYCLWLGALGLAWGGPTPTRGRR